MIPFAIKRIDHIVFRVSDLDRSIAFYSHTLGCQVVKRRPELGLIHLRAGESMIDLISLTGPLGQAGGSGPGREGRNVDHLCLRVDPFNEQALSAHLQKCGARVRGPASINFGAEGNGLSLYFEDPDGNVVELKGPAIPVQHGAS
jgi:glyoxylase I family protein